MIAESLGARVVALNIPLCSPATGSVVIVSIGLATLSPDGSGNCITLIELDGLRTGRLNLVQVFISSLEATGC